MIEAIKNLFKKDTPTDFAALVRDGAVIIDVRSKREYELGHISGSLNVPVDQLKNNLHRIPDKKKTVIACCASGVRSSSAVEILRSTGFEKVFNGGSWASLEKKI
jgi:phage shock protein E